MWGLPSWLSGEEPACRCRRHKRWGLDPWVGEDPLEKKWQPTPVFLPGISHGQRALAGYSPWGHKKSQTRLCDQTATTRVCEVVFHCGFNLYFRNDCWCWASFHILIVTGHMCIFPGEMSVHTVYLFFNWFFFFNCWVVELFILWIQKSFNKIRDLKISIPYVVFSLS